MKESIKISLVLSMIAYFFGTFLSIVFTSKNKIHLTIFSDGVHIDGNFIAPILYNNLYTILLTILGGFTMASLTTAELMLNGMTIGGLFLILPSDIFVSLILPHGIFEIPAIIIAGAAGFKIPYEVIRYLAGRKEQVLTKEDIKEYLTLALISIVLIVIAAWIEANVTLEIAKRLDMGR
jgi:uncharacterized membrane protein SpoIIM required for sporulation